MVTILSISRCCVIAAQADVDLGKTSTFAVLSGQTITNTGPTTISGSAGGNVGLFPGPGFPGRTSVTMSGSIHIADVDASEAKDALVALYLDVAGRVPVTRIPPELGQKTLKAGTYDSEAGSFLINGTLTLDAEGDPDAIFIFKMQTTLITGSSSNIKLINGTQHCKIFWQVGSSATLGTNSNFVGHLLALTSITARTGAVIQGQLLARNGSVTLDSNTIINSICGDYIDYSDTIATGGRLPNTTTPIYLFLTIGIILIIVGIIGIIIKKKI